MQTLKLLLFLVLICQFFSPAANAENKAVILIHGGAGVESGMTEQEQESYKKELCQALLKAHAAWKSGAKAVDVAAAAICYLEDCPLFNAGRGAVFSYDGKNELDAAIMDGKSREAGSVASVLTIKNPILAAIQVMRNSKHVMLVGSGADSFAKEQGLEIVSPDYFKTEKRWQDLQKKLNKIEPKSQKEAAGHRYGTVGAVVLDSAGNLSAGTSTGGLTGKRWGRVGDTPIIGAGTFADNESCAASCTGEGEWFIRFNVASDLAARVKYAKQPLQKAADAIIHGVLGPERGEGGLIAIDKKGNFAFSFNSAGMFRGYIGADGKPHAFVY